MDFSLEAVLCGHVNGPMSRLRADFSGVCFMAELCKTNLRV